MLRKGLAVAVILLFIGVAFAPSINADVSKSSVGPVPDLDCEGELIWIDVVPGATVTGTFTVENIGEPLSMLDWEITEYPDWGTWTFVPDSGEDLTPEDGVFTINVEVVAPDEQEDDEWDEIKIVNLENSSDYCIIGVFLKGESVPVVKNIKQTIMSTVSSHRNTTEPLDVGRWIIRGSGLFPIFWGDNVTFFAINLSIIIITGTQRDVVTISKRWITLPKDIVPLYIFPLYRLIYIFLLYVGDFEPPDNIMMLNNEMRI